MFLWTTDAGGTSGIRSDLARHRSDRRLQDMSKTQFTTPQKISGRDV